MKILKLTTVMLFIGTIAFGQYQITGKVIDSATSEPLPGANVTLDGVASASSSDLDGLFRIVVVTPGNYTLKFSFVGYSSRDKAVQVLGDVNLGEITLSSEPYLADEVIVSATRADENSPITFTTLNKKQINKQDFGQDLPFLLNFMPSLVTTSDAGAGVGYTGLRIRGSDATRINVTINGIPLNDSESQGVFWVNTPDLASSTESIQVQRGVGTSTNGAGAFGATVNLQTNARNEKAYSDIVNAVGSYNTRRHTISFGSGLIDDQWTFDGRLSKIASDGYIDRATSDLQSYYLSGGYYRKNTLIKAIIFGGEERTYQAWYGTPQAVLENDSEGIEAVIANNGLSNEQADNMRTAGRTFNWYLYDNEVDNYQQDHYQLHISQQITADMVGNVALHYTYGRGFFEQFREDDSFSDYQLPNLTIGNELIEESDFIRRRWLDNHFYGLTYSLNYSPHNWNVTLGGAYNEYDGDHFGEIIWAEFGQNAFIGNRYYDNKGTKLDFNSFLKISHQFTEPLNVFVDLQYRNIDYKIDGIDNDLRALSVSEDYDFFNPKVGFIYRFNKGTLYSSYSIGNREPVRSDFVDSPVAPKREKMKNREIGYRFLTKKIQFSTNFYLMDYEDQLVLTGDVNDVGSSLRMNVSESYRAGIELEGAVKWSDKMQWNANLTLSRNKIKNFTEVLIDYGETFDGFDVIENMYQDTDIAFSPNIIAGSQLTYTPFENFEVGVLTKYVGDQFLDNTSNDARKIDAYFVNDLRLNYSIKDKLAKEIGINLLINNILNEKYSSNGYTFGYFGGSEFEVRENYFYPQAPRNFLLSLVLKF